MMLITNVPSKYFFPFFRPGSELNQVQVLLQSPNGDETILPSWDWEVILVKDKRENQFWIEATTIETPGEVVSWKLSDRCLDMF